MRLLSRIARLEELVPQPPVPCPGCGGIDGNGDGLFYGGVTIPELIPAQPGIWWCMCKSCHRRFTCRMEGSQGEVHLVRGARVELPYRRGDPIPAAGII